MSPHYGDLRAYFVNLVRDMATRGVIRQKKGQPLADLVREEAAVVGAALWQDVKALLLEFGISVTALGSDFLDEAVKQAVPPGTFEHDVLRRSVQEGKRMLFDVLLGQKRK